MIMLDECEWYINEIEKEKAISVPKSIYISFK
mgnify:CR=1 FL=1